MSQTVRDYFWIFRNGVESRGLFAYMIQPIRPHKPHSTSAVAWAESSGEMDSWEYDGVVISMRTVALPDEDIPTSVDAWLALFEGILSVGPTRAGSLAWLGGEDSSWNPEVLQPGNSAGNVVAAFSDRLGGLICDIENVDAIQFLDDASLESVWHQVQRIWENGHSGA